VRIPQVPLKTGYIPFVGGLDVSTPPILVQPGTCSSAQNIVHDVNGGYAIHKGYERFDGHTSPSSARYALLAVTLTEAVAVGDVVTDGVAQGVVIAMESADLVLTKLVGTFTAGDILVGATTVGTCAGAQRFDAASTTKLHAQYKALAADVYRSDIAAPSGSGRSLGGKLFNGVVYTFRNAADGLSALLYKSSSSGWVSVPLGHELYFTSGGTVVPAVGNTITGAVSGAFATLTAIVVTSGAWSSGDAAGKFIFAAKTGTFQAENLNIGASLNVASIAAASSPISLAPNGRYKIVEANFTGNASTKKMYGIDGANRGFEFDGTAFVPIDTGMTTDKPENVWEHANHLFFSFDGSAQHSSPGEPHNWSVVIGAGELGTGDNITGFRPQPGDGTSGVLAIFSRNRISMLYGTDYDTWQMIQYKDDAGGRENSIQRMGNTYFADDRGIMQLSASQSYGNFGDSSLSKKIQPWLKTKLALITDSCIMRDDNRYCLFFSDGTGVYATLDGGKVIGFLPVTFPDPVLWVDSSEDTSGNERVFFGSSDGFIYEMNKGTSFDGADIEWWADLHFVNFRTPNTEKKFRKLTVEVFGNGYSEFDFGYALEYGSTEVAQPLPGSEVLSLAPSKWDAFTWDAFYWDGVDLFPAYLDLYGNATNISLRLRGKSNYCDSARFSGALILYSLTREKR
jgi:hypothetical protein